MINQAVSDDNNNASKNANNRIESNNNESQNNEETINNEQICRYIYRDLNVKTQIVFILRII